MPRAFGLDDKVRKRGRLMLCGSCHEYIYAKENDCPHCGAENRPAEVIEEPAALDVRKAIDEIERHGRRILAIAGITDEPPLAPH
jgi:hypothetical protein